MKQRLLVPYSGGCVIPLKKMTLPYLLLSGMFGGWDSRFEAMQNGMREENWSCKKERDGVDELGEAGMGDTSVS